MLYFFVVNINFERVVLSTVPYSIDIPKLLIRCNCFPVLRAGGSHILFLTESVMYKGMNESLSSHCV